MLLGPAGFLLLSMTTDNGHPLERPDTFARFAYPNPVGPGVYDLHSPRIPDRPGRVELRHRASRVSPAENLGVNPDCGLKTRGWAETRAALEAMVAAARHLHPQPQPAGISCVAIPTVTDPPSWSWPTS